MRQVAGFPVSGTSPSACAGLKHRPFIEKAVNQRDRGPLTFV